MMSEMQLDLKASIEHLRSRRPIAQPNIGFLIQLKNFEKELFGKNSDVPLLSPTAAVPKTPSGSEET
jgi:hypothetical protein